MIWPLPALLAWAASWGLFIGLTRADTPVAPALGLAAALGLVLAVTAATPWRRIFVAAGFPLSLAASGWAGSLPAWAWLLPLVLLVLLYPVNSWRDAPMFPTPAGALQGLAGLAPLPEGAKLLDAGCGLGDGLRELRREYPLAQLAGVEWSWPLRIACAWRCRFAHVRRGDLWASDWAQQDLVYLFQRPESMPRAVDKARRELRPGAWLASLEFEAPGVRPTAVLRAPGRKPLWLYRAPLA
ncbi:class I SAM-dependent methyltransferase [Rhizobacter sp. AJA081-3]|uniref:class I SAM-dependent methyltransferase n=1 Tax=Rhizobacter sp. AJA081-3 TaxID=2753607 RepID=UPI001ADED1A6|nr:class I SAM-dependent methyltransferase [Rhizobacter sp. AJA081-3]QTN24069.1 class I SAM-dependent methyltransferase [Rhizobacter sp. AJA081-3]